MALKAIAFDLDGTLVDSAGGVAHALNAALDDAGLPRFDVRTVRTWIGDGPDALIARALDTLDTLDTGSRDRDELAGRLRRGFDAATLASPFIDCEVYAGIAELLAELAPRFPLAVITNKPTLLARAVLQAAGLLRHFKTVHGADTRADRKPSPHMLQQAASALQVQPAQVLMVGDAATDIATAHAAGAQAAWAGWGYGEAPAALDPAVWRLGRPSDLSPLLDRTASGGPGA